MTLTAERTSGTDATPASAPRGRVLLPAVAATWSLVYLGLGTAWLAGAGGNPADPTVDDVGSGVSVLPALGPDAGAWLLTGLAALGVVLSGVLALVRPTAGRVGLLRRVPVALAGALGLVLAVVLPDYRVLAASAYTPILLVLELFGVAPDEVDLWPWPVANMGLLSLGGLAWMATAVVHARRIGGACDACGRGIRPRPWTTPEAATRWGRWATGVAVAVPVGYAVTRFAWALGIPLGVDQQLLDDLGDGVYAGAGLATLGVGGAVLTLGLVQRWGEVFPRWMVGLRGREVPVLLAVVPAALVSVVVGSAGLMFVRIGLAGGLEPLPGEVSDVAAWLPEMFWPLWSVSLAAATYAYWLRRRRPCGHCGRGTRRGVTPAAIRT